MCSFIYFHSEKLFQNLWIFAEKKKPDFFFATIKLDYESIVIDQSINRIGQSEPISNFEFTFIPLIIPRFFLIDPNQWKLFLKYDAAIIK